MNDAVVHPTAIIDADVTLGRGSRIWHFCHVSAGAEIGERCILGQNVFVAPGVKLGNGVKVQNNVSIYVGVEIEDDAFLGPSCVFTNVLNPRAHIERKSEFRRTRVGKGATIGANATIVCGHDLGDYAMVGAGSVVTRDVPGHGLAYGVPARLRGWVCRCGEQIAHREDARCHRCGDEYRIVNERCELLRSGTKDE